MTNPRDTAIAQYEEAAQRLNLDPGLHHVRERLQRVITRAYREVCARAQKETVSLREAALLLAVSRVEEAARLRGIYP